MGYLTLQTSMPLYAHAHLLPVAPVSYPGDFAVLAAYYGYFFTGLKNFKLTSTSIHVEPMESFSIEAVGELFFSFHDDPYVLLRNLETSPLLRYIGLDSRLHHRDSLESHHQFFQGIEIVNAYRDRIQDLHLLKGPQRLPLVIISRTSDTLSDGKPLDNTNEAIVAYRETVQVFARN